MQDTKLEEIRTLIARKGVEAALILLTQDGYINWAARYAIQRKDVRPEWLAH